MAWITRCSRRFARAARGLAVLASPLAISACILGGPDATGRQPSGAGRESVQVGATTRTFVSHVPPDLPESPPLLLAFHGSGSTGEAMRRLSGLDAQADARRFIVVYPDSPLGNWAEGCNCNVADRLGVDDVGFVRALIDKFALEHAIDRRRVYAVGFSQGGLFVHRLACDAADRFAAMAVVAGAMPVPLAERCAPSRPVAMFILHGTEDAVLPYEDSGAGKLALLGARSAAAKWRSLDGCQGAPAVQDDPAAVDGTRLHREVTSDCDDDAAVTLYTVEGGGHAWRLSGGLGTEATVTSALLERAAPPPR